MKLKDRGFSDKLYFLNFTITWIFVLICIAITLLSGYLNITDLSLVSYGIPTVFAELGVHTGYIVWKAKSENINKHPVIVDRKTMVKMMYWIIDNFYYIGVILLAFIEAIGIGYYIYLSKRGKR